MTAQALKPSSASTNNHSFAKDLASGLELISLPVEPNAYEKYWVNALSERLNGATEVTIPHGRVDILTQQIALEVDFLQKWHEGLGQAIHYASVTGRKGALALILPAQTQNHSNHSLIEIISELCDKSGVRLILLRSEF